MSKSDRPDFSDEIAVVGMVGRFPKARNLEEFWQNLRDGSESLSFFSDEELRSAGVDPALLSNPNYVKAKGFLEDIELFDAAFFDLNPREAELLDPQHRFLLECAWEAIENAGYDPATYEGRIGVFAGQGINTYSLFNIFSNPELLETVGLYQAMLGSDRDYLTTRVSYKLNLRGPSVNVQTACSTSLVAIHMACQSLLNGECSMALAGGVSVSVPQKTGYLYQEGMVLSPDGHCRAFDAKAQGCVEGSGVGIVVLRTLQDALDSRDHIHAVIKGSAINNDGSLKAGYTAPSVQGQAEVIGEALAVASIEADTISYVEAHGTGTDLGDPIEIAALTLAFGDATKRTGSCAIGSVKTNIGHLDAAAGVAGFIKTVLALRHKLLPASLHFERSNPQIDFDNSPFHVNAMLSEWLPRSIPRRAGVSSFGIGGTNAHVILEEAPAQGTNNKARPRQLLTLSARTRSALEAVTANLAGFFQRQPDSNLADTAYTLQVGRKTFGHRRILVCHDIADAMNALEKMNPDRVFTHFEQSKYRPVAFLFPGQGAQYVNMGATLYREEQAFREQIDLCSELLRSHIDLDLRDLLYPAKDKIEQASEQLNQTFVTQPALFTVEYALARLWINWGVQPQAMIGHSIGEYVAACLAGVFSLEDALALVASRGRLMQSLPAGAMLAVLLPEEELAQLINHGVSLAAINGPSRCVISGPVDAVDQLQYQLTQRGVGYQRLATSHAFHSEMMDSIIRPFARLVRTIKLSAPNIPYLSNVSGTWITTEQATDSNYWAMHLRQPVEFEKGLRELLREPTRILLEVGPGKVLSSLAKHHPEKSDEQIACSSLPHPESRQPEQTFLLNALGQLWMAGVQVDWPSFYAYETRNRVPLPTYPFERARYWIEPQRRAPVTAHNQIEAKKPDVADWFYVPLWKQSTLPSYKAGGASGKPAWLIFVDEIGVGAQIARKLERQGQQVITVAAAETFAKLHDRHYAINPQSTDDYMMLLDELRLSGSVPRMIVHLWAVTASDQIQTNNYFRNYDDSVFFSLLYLARALGGLDANISDQFKVAIVSSYMQRVAGEAALHPHKALLLGPCRVIPQEYPNVACRSIDITVDGRRSAQQERLIDQLIGEFYAESTDTVVAYRDNSRWVQNFETLRLDETSEDAPRLREGGVYLITGGLGGIGLELAGYLAKAARARLVLTSRSEIPEKQHWEEWLSAHAGDEVSRKIEKLKEIEAAGAEVVTFSADVTDHTQMQQVIRHARERFGEINGVIHAAGVAGGGLIQLRTPEMAAGVLAPKVRGTLVLEDLFRDSKLDFFILCSSLNSIIGGIGQADYCAANAFLDAFAQYNTYKNDTFTVSINWDAWQEVGMAARSPLSSVFTESQQGSFNEVDHPLFDHYVNETPEQRTYVTDFSPDKHWILNDHRIVGNPVVPGTAYIEMARAALQEGAIDKAIEIRDLFFITPLRVRDGETKRVHTLMEKDGDGFKFSMKSQDDSENGHAPKWQTHAMGNARYIDKTIPESLLIDELVARCNERLILPPEQWPEDDGPRWRVLQSLHISKDEALAAIELPEALSGDLQMYHLHPALMDVATGVPKQYLREGSDYLPLSYKRLRVYGPLSKKIYSYARYKEDGSSNKETVTFDLTITDENGMELVLIEEFTAKRVNDAAARIKAWGEVDPHRSEQSLSGGSFEGQATSEETLRSDSNQGILAEEGVSVFSRIISKDVPQQVAVSVMDLQTVITRARALSLSNPLGGTEHLESFRPKSVHPRPDLQTPYVAPTNELEQNLSKIWQELLGIERVGVQDNFFELGGDSVVAIQIIANANQIGIEIAPRQIFEHQTIAELAMVSQTNDAVASQQEPVTGVVPLTPMQAIIFERNSAAPYPRSRTILVKLRHSLDASLLISAVRHLIAHHDALRLRFTELTAGWQQVNAGIDDLVPFSSIDISLLPDHEQDSAIESAAQSLRASLTLSEGPLMRIALFDLGSSRPNHLLIIIADLVADDTSWRILLDDLQMACEQLHSGNAVQLQPKTTSFKYWAEQLARRAQSEQSEEEVNYWLNDRQTQAPRLPVKGSDNNGTSTSFGAVKFSLSGEETKSLLHEIHQAYHTQIEDVLLTALVQSFSLLLNARSLLIDLEADWRDEAIRNVDLSRTVGRFTYPLPVYLSLGKVPNPGQELKLVKEQLRRIRDIGIGYGLSRHITPESETAKRLRNLPVAQVCFKYAVELDRTLPNSALFELEHRLNGPAHDEHVIYPYQISISAFTIASRLQLVLEYAERMHDRSTIERLARNYEQSLRSLIAHCKSSNAGGYTPSDFPFARLDEQKLTKLSQLIKKTDAS